MTLKVGILGTRHVHAEGLAECAINHGAELIGAYEADEDSRKAWTTSPLLSLDDLLNKSDCVIAAGTNRERVAGTLAAMQRGLFVLSEKPVAYSPEELQKLITSASPDSFMTAFPLRFSPALVRAKSAIAAGALGTPIAARCTNHGQFPGGWFGSMYEAGGGALQDHIVHISDALCWLLGDKVNQVFARSSKTLLPELEVESAGIVTLDFASGFFASIDSSWSRPKSFPTWGDVWLEIVGTKGRIRIDPMATSFDLFDDELGKLRHVAFTSDDMTQIMVSSFLEFVSDNNLPSPVTFDEGVHASDIVFAAYNSVRSGQPEPVAAR